MLAIGNGPGSVKPMNTHQMYQQANAQWQTVMSNNELNVYHPEVFIDISITYRYKG